MALLYPYQDPNDPRALMRRGPRAMTNQTQFASSGASHMGLADSAIKRLGLTPDPVSTPAQSPNPLPQQPLARQAPAPVPPPNTPFSNPASEAQYQATYKPGSAEWMAARQAGAQSTNPVVSGMNNDMLRGQARSSAVANFGATGGGVTYQQANAMGMDAMDSQRTNIPIDYTGMIRRPTPQMAPKNDFSAQALGPVNPGMPASPLARTPVAPLGTPERATQIADRNNAYDAQLQKSLGREDLYRQNIADRAAIIQGGQQYRDDRFTTQMANREGMQRLTPRPGDFRERLMQQTAMRQQAAMAEQGMRAKLEMAKLQGAPTEFERERTNTERIKQQALQRQMSEPTPKDLDPKVKARIGVLENRGKSIDERLKMMLPTDESYADVVKQRAEIDTQIDSMLGDDGGDAMDVPSDPSQLKPGSKYRLNGMVYQFDGSQFNPL